MLLLRKALLQENPLFPHQIHTCFLFASDWFRKTQYFVSIAKILIKKKNKSGLTPCEIVHIWFFLSVIPEFWSSQVKKMYNQNAKLLSILEMECFFLNRPPWKGDRVPGHRGWNAEDYFSKAVNCLWPQITPPPLRGMGLLAKSVKKHLSPEA